MGALCGFGAVGFGVSGFRPGTPQVPFHGALMVLNSDYLGYNRG